MSMSWRESCAAVIPCLNEAEALGPLLEGVRRHLNQIIVINDGSGDQTAEIAKGAGVHLLNHPRTLGKGAALRTGWAEAQRLGFSWVICLDGDGQHDPAVVPRFFEKADQTGASLIIGNRMGEAHKIPIIRRFVNGWMSGQLSRKAGRYLPDSQCGYRLINLQDLSRAGSAGTAAHFEIESDTLLCFVRAGLKVEFVPVPVIYGAEVSKINPITDTLRWFNWWRRV
jgi:glycosyltransferase involved in cell wall biosynthesis